MKTSETIPLKGLSPTGKVVWYTGRTGAGWVSENRSDAFTYTLEGARRKASVLNQMTEVHGYRFVAVAPEPTPQVPALPGMTPLGIKPTPKLKVSMKYPNQVLFADSLDDGRAEIFTAPTMGLAETIVRAFNAHDDLVAVLTAIRNIAHENFKSLGSPHGLIQRLANDALAKAEGRAL